MSHSNRLQYVYPRCDVRCAKTDAPGVPMALDVEEHQLTNTKMSGYPSSSPFSYVRQLQVGRRHSRLGIVMHLPTTYARESLFTSGTDSTDPEQAKPLEHETTLATNRGAQTFAGFLVDVGVGERARRQTTPKTTTWTEHDFDRERLTGRRIQTNAPAAVCTHCTLPIGQTREASCRWSQCFGNWSCLLQGANLLFPLPPPLWFGESVYEA
ncbi:uncharacterized protein LOC142766124 [Rhipicephalus microplus]|uniref:uncharacterized protein LOC142766124 n=1 Tax=Rhipicephalus microplus TaxID=6941 RepID=UPI003F6C46E9